MFSKFYLSDTNNVSPPYRHQLKCPGQYSPLEAFYEDKKAVLPPTGNGVVNACPTSTWATTTINRCMHPEMKVFSLYMYLMICLYIHTSLLGVLWSRVL